MFVCWKKRISQAKEAKWSREYIDGKYHSRMKSEEEIDYTLSAYLMQSVRVNGKPRQKSIAFLISISRKDIEAGEISLQLWEHIVTTVIELALDEPTKEKVYAAIAEKTPRPPQASLEKAEQKAKELLASGKLPKPFVPMPSAPPLLGTKDTSNDTERPLYIKWINEHSGKYAASLIKETTDANGKKQRIRIAHLGPIKPNQFAKMHTNYRKEIVVNTEWQAYWYQVHRSLSLAQVDRETYQETFRLLGKRVELPQPEELRQCIKAGYANERREIEVRMKELLEKHDQLEQKQQDFALIQQQSPVYDAMSTTL